MPTAAAEAQHKQAATTDADYIANMMTAAPDVVPQQFRASIDDSQNIIEVGRHSAR